MSPFWFGFCIFWLIGSVVACIVGFIEATYYQKKGENIDEFCGGMCVIIAMGWIYLIMSRKRLVELFTNDD